MWLCLLCVLRSWCIIGLVFQLYFCFFFFVFFFQAEDGIRDRDVTGVQTCALPISIGKPNPVSSSRFCSEISPNRSAKQIFVFQRL